MPRLWKTNNVSYLWGGIAVEEIKVGEYVRTKEGIIDKIDAFNINTNIYHCENGLCIDKENKIAVALKDINHSKNIIDLIEVRRYSRISS